MTDVPPTAGVLHELRVTGLLQPQCAVVPRGQQGSVVQLIRAHQVPASGHQNAVLDSGAALSEHQVEPALTFEQLRPLHERRMLQQQSRCAHGSRSRIIERNNEDAGEATAAGPRVRLHVQQIVPALVVE